LGMVLFSGFAAGMFEKERTYWSWDF